MRISCVTGVAALLFSVSFTFAQPAPEITRHALPAEVTFPEGIALDASGASIYTASAHTGIVVRIPLDGTAATTVAAAGSVLPGEPFPTALGMKLDDAGRLWMAGGRTGRMAVIDTKSGAVVKRFETPTAATSLINDVALVAGHAYFTDTFTPTLWRVATSGDRIGDLEPWISFAGTPLTYADGPNLNGIAATPDGRHLIVVQMNKGLLFRIDLADKRVSPIDVGGEALSGGDGLVLDGSTLYVVRQTEGEIVTLELSKDLASGRLVNRFRDPALAWPATAVKHGDRLLVVNSQFNRRRDGTARAPFEVLSIPLGMLSNGRR